MSFQIHTPRFVLRDFELSDIAHYTAQCQDKKYQRFYNDEDCSIEKCDELVKMFIAQAKISQRNAYHLAITDRVTGEYLGIAGLRLENEKQASMGCGLVRNKQHKHVAHEAMKALLEFGFQHLQVHRAYAETISDNIAAVKLCKSIGMRQEAELIQNRYFKNQWWNTTILAILSSEFPRQ